MNEKPKKRKKADPAPYTTFGLSGGLPLTPEAGTTKPPESNTDEMRRWSQENQK